MSLINCKVILKRKWTRQCVLDAAGVNNVNANDDNISFISKAQNYMFIGKRESKLSKLLSKWFERSVNIKQKMIITIQQMSIDFFSNQKL